MVILKNANSCPHALLADDVIVLNVVRMCAAVQTYVKFYFYHLHVKFCFSCKVFNVLGILIFNKGF